jgi:hypothetical protein
LKAILASLLWWKLVVSRPPDVKRCIDILVELCKHIIEGVGIEPLVLRPVSEGEAILVGLLEALHMIYLHPAPLLLIVLWGI